MSTSPDWTVRGSRRFSSEKQILAEIDKCHANSRRALEKAEAIDLQIRQARDNAPANVDEDQLSQMIRDLKIRARMFRTYATNQINSKARKLGVKLSEFRTEIMPILSDPVRREHSTKVTVSNFYDNAIPCKGDITHGTGQPDLSHLDEITLRRVLGKLVLTIGDWEHTFSPEQERILSEQLEALQFDRAFNVQVCAECLQASCWQGKFLCDKSENANTIYLSRIDLKKLNREHPSYWKTDAELSGQ